MSSRTTTRIPVAQGAPCCASLLTQPLDEEQADDLAVAFAALADPIRVRLFNLVAQAGEICSCDLQEPLGRSQPTISHHTRLLAEAGLIVGDKRGRWTWWSVDPARVEALRGSLAP